MTDSMKALAVIPRSDAEMITLAEQLSKSSLLPKEMQGKMPNVLVTILAGQEMGLSPMASLRNFHVIEGKPVLSSDGMTALVLGSGKCVYFRRTQESADSVTYETMRVGDTEPRRCTWTKQMIKDAALASKDNHRLYPRQMLAARAKAELARDVYPDVLAGCYIEDEVDHLEARSVSNARPVSSGPVDATDAEIASDLEVTLSAIDNATTTEELRKVGETLKALTEEQKVKAREKYGERLDLLKKAEATEKAS